MRADYERSTSNAALGERDVVVRRRVSATRTPSPPFPLGLSAGKRLLSSVLTARVDAGLVW